MVLMYLHGFRSTPMSKKGQIMREAFSGRVQYLAPDLNTSPSHVQTIIQEAIKGIAPEELCLVGSSLGGFLIFRYMGRIRTNAMPDREWRSICQM